MISGTLQGIRLAILLSDGFAESELLEPKRALDRAGAATFIISPDEQRVRGWMQNTWGMEVPVDIHLKSAKSDDFHALMLPGGAMNADHLRRDPEALRFVRHFLEARKPVAASCDGVSIVLHAGGVRGRTLTSSLSLKAELEKNGATWLDADVVCDGTLITSRNPDDLQSFIREMMRVFFEVREHSTEMRRRA
jgi:protease I